MSVFLWELYTSTCFKFEAFKKAHEKMQELRACEEVGASF